MRLAMSVFLMSGPAFTKNPPFKNKGQFFELRDDLPRHGFVSNQQLERGGDTFAALYIGLRKSMNVDGRSMKGRTKGYEKSPFRT